MSREVPERTFSFFPDDSFLQSQSQSLDVTPVKDTSHETTDFFVGDITPEKQKTSSRNATPSKQSEVQPPPINVRRRKHGSRKLFSNKPKFLPPLKGAIEKSGASQDTSISPAVSNSPEGYKKLAVKRLFSASQSHVKDDHSFEVPKLPAVKVKNLNGNSSTASRSSNIPQDIHNNTLPIDKHSLGNDGLMQVVPDTDILSTSQIQPSDERVSSPQSNLLLENKTTDNQKTLFCQQQQQQQLASDFQGQPQQIELEPQDRVTKNNALSESVFSKKWTLSDKRPIQLLAQQSTQDDGIGEHELRQGDHEEAYEMQQAVGISADSHVGMTDQDLLLHTVPCSEDTAQVSSRVHTTDESRVPQYAMDMDDNSPCLFSDTNIEAADQFFGAPHQVREESLLTSREQSLSREGLDNAVGRADSNNTLGCRVWNNQDLQLGLDRTSQNLSVFEGHSNLPDASISPSEPFSCSRWQMSQRAPEQAVPESIVVKEEIQSPFMYSGQHMQDLPYTIEKKESMEGIENHLLRWVMDGSAMIELQKQCALFKVDESECIPVYELWVSIDVQSLIDYHEQVGSLVLKSPLLFCYLLKQVCFHILKSEGLVGKLYSQYQVIVTPLYTNAPSITENTVISLSDLSLLKRNAGQLFQVKGMVIGMSSLSPYTKCAKYICSETDCAWSKENCYIISCNVSSVENDLIRNDFPCSGCGNSLKDDIAWRKSAEKRYCFVIPKNEASNLKNMNARGYSTSIKIVLKDKLKDAVVIGGCYWFTGVFKHDISNEKVRITFEVFSVMDDVPFLHRMKNFQKVLPDSLCTLYQDRRSSPWSFVASLAYCFLGTVVPPGTYYLFKYCLLLSLIIGGDKTLLDIESNQTKHNNLNIMVNDDDVLPYQRMMLLASSCTDAPVVHRVPMDLFGSVTQHDSLVYVDGGTLALASTNVCLIPNMLELNKKEMDQLKTTLENSIITINVPKKQHEQVQQNQFQIPLTTSIWACNQIQVGCTRDYVPKEVSSVPPALTSLFNLVFNERLKKSVDDVDIDVAFSDQVLQNAMDTSNEFTSMISQDDFREFICHVRHLEVQMSKEAYKLIKTFYMVSRRICNDPALLPQTTLQTILSLAAAHARAMLFRTVTVDNAIAAIYVFEQLSSLSHGESTFGVVPVVHFLSQDISKHLGPENDERMRQFKSSLIQYCSYYYPEVQDLVKCDSSLGSFSHSQVVA